MKLCALFLLAATVACLGVAVPGLQVDISTSGRVTNVVLNSTALTLNGDGGFEMADYANQPTPTNLASNPGFESGLTSWGTSGNVVNDPVTYHSGTNAARMYIPSGPANAAIGQTITVNPSTQYRLSFWLSKEGMASYGDGAYYLFEQADGTPIGGQVALNTYMATTNTWYSFSFDITTPSNCGKLYFYSSIYQDQGSLWIDDVSLTDLGKIFSPVSGTYSGGTFTGTSSNVLVTASITTNSSAILISGTLTNQAATDRAIALRFKLPITATNWVWHDDALSNRTVSTAMIYKNTTVTEAGPAERSIYPLGVLADTTGTNNLAMAWPMLSSPRIFVTEYDNVNKALQFTVYLGLSTNATKSYNAGSFSLAIYPTLSAYGFRSALSQYYTLYSSSFTKRTPETPYNYGNNEVFTNNVLSLGGTGTYLYTNAVDFGTGYGYMGLSLHGVAYASYWVTNSVSRPTDAAIRAWLPSYPAGDQYPGSNAVTQLMTDATGAIRYTASSYDAGTTTWYLEYYVNQDPDITSGLTSLLDSTFTSFFSTPRTNWSITLSSDFFNGSEILDYDTNHIAKSDFPPTFGNSSNTPAVMSGTWDFYSTWLYPRSTTNKFAIMGNTGSADVLFVAPYVDVQMIEGIRTMAEYYSYRAFAKSKIVRNWTTIAPTGGAVYTPAEFNAELNNCLRLAIYPSLGTTLFGNMTETFRPLYKVYVPAITLLSAAGWEPVNGASATAGAVVERFGSYPANLYLSVANTTTNSVTTTVTLDQTALSIPAGTTLAIQDLIAGTTTKTAAGSFSATLTNGQTKAYSLQSAGTIRVNNLRVKTMKGK